MSRRIRRSYVPDPLVETLTAMRIKRGYTQAALAEQLGISQSMVSDLETGKCSPNLETIRQYLDFYDADLKVI